MSATLHTEVTRPPFSLVEPDAQRAPLLFASPHSGRDYPLSFLAESRLDAQALRRSEDSFVDELFAVAPSLGAPLLSANFPRAWCDANRERWELDPRMFADRLPQECNVGSARVRAGFGTIARIVADGAPIYRRKLLFAEAEARIAACWDPYHHALRAAIDATIERFGTCLVVDCHSMPSDGAAGRIPVRFVLGDAHGTSCAPAVTRHVEHWLRDRGHAVRLNDPYAGGYVTRRYGRPADGIHVLQLEIARSLYMDERRHDRRPEFSAFRDEMTRLVADLVAHPDLTRGD